MLVALIARDKEGALQTRKDNREAHLQYIEESGVVSQAGPLLSNDGDMIGSLIVLDVEDVPAAKEWTVNDPYAKADLFSSVQLVRWNKVVG